MGRLGVRERRPRQLSDSISTLSYSGDWSWRATISWSPDNTRFPTTVHGAPVGREPAEFSPVFNVAVADAERQFQARYRYQCRYLGSTTVLTFIDTPDSQFPKGYFAYLRARDPFNSINGEYDLIVADRDGSNARILFPVEGRPGLAAQESIFQDREFAWSPDGHQIAIIYQGNLWIVDVKSGISHQLTLDGRASTPIWTR